MNIASLNETEIGTFFLKGPIVNLSGFEDHTVRVTTMQLSLVVQNPNGQGCVPGKLFPLLTVTPFTPMLHLVSEAFTVCLYRFAQAGLQEVYFDLVLVIV